MKDKNVNWISLVGSCLTTNEVIKYKGIIISEGANQGQYLA